MTHGATIDEKISETLVGNAISDSSKKTHLKKRRRRWWWTMRLP
jgi:hypothetical protein